MAQCIRCLSCHFCFVKMRLNDIYLVASSYGICSGTNRGLKFVHHGMGVGLRAHTAIGVGEYRVSPRC